EPTWHFPSLQTGVAWTRTQGLPQAPQFDGSCWVSTSQPLVELLSQFLKPMLHVPSVHWPPVHAAEALEYVGQGVQYVGLQPYFGSSVGTHIPLHTFSLAPQFGPESVPASPPAPAPPVPVTVEPPMPVMVEPPVPVVPVELLLLAAPQPAQPATSAGKRRKN